VGRAVGNDCAGLKDDARGLAPVVMLNLLPMNSKFNQSRERPSRLPSETFSPRKVLVKLTVESTVTR
jgi:hypothetical protein